MGEKARVKDSPDNGLSSEQSSEHGHGGMEDVSNLGLEGCEFESHCP